MCTELVVTHKKKKKKKKPLAPSTGLHLLTFTAGQRVAVDTPTTTIIIHHGAQRMKRAFPRPDTVASTPCADRAWAHMHGHGTVVIKKDWTLWSSRHGSGVKTAFV